MSELDALVERVRSLPRPLLMAFDVDGTLAPIYRDPAKVKVADDVVARLLALDGREGVTVAVVTGRDATSLARILSARELYRVVEHGARLLRPGEGDGPAELDPRDREHLDTFRAWAEAELAPRGAHVEVKERAVGIHVRVLAERDPEAAHAILAETEARASQDSLACRDGKWIREVTVGAHAEKSETVARLVDELGVASILYVGDDLTDFEAIALAARRGVGLFVASDERPEGPPEATATLPDQPAVLDLIAALDAAFES